VAVGKFCGFFKIILVILLGGPPNCKIRNCARKKKLMGCWQCDDFQTCDKLRFLEMHHGVAHLKNLRKLKKQGPDAFFKGKRYWCAPK